MLHTKPIRALAACTAFGLCIAGAPAAQALTVTYEVEIDALGSAGEAATVTLDIDDAFVAGFTGRDTTLGMGTATVSFASGAQPISWPDVVVDCVQAPCPEADALTGFDLGEFAVPDEALILALGIKLDEAVDTPNELLAALMSVSVLVGSFDTSSGEAEFLSNDVYQATARGLTTPLPGAALLFAGSALGLGALCKRVSRRDGSL